MKGNIWSWQRLAIAGVLCLGLVAAGCNGDDDDDNGDTSPTAGATTDLGSPTEAGTESESPTEAGTETESPTEADESPTEAESPTEDATGSPVAGDLQGFCDANLAISTVPEPDIDFESLTPEELTEAMQEYASETLLPLVDDVRAEAPAEMQEQIEVLAGAVETAAETGEFPETPEVQQAEEELDAFLVENCDWNEQTVTAVDYEFEGLPEDAEAGVHLFRLENEGDEVHELVLMRKNDGVTTPVEELIELPEDEALSMLTFTGVAFAAPGESESFTVELEAGDYVVVCFVPVGTTSLDAEPDPSAPPHAAEGMYGEFTVE